jgi:hypothetical protein
MGALTQGETITGQNGKVTYGATPTAVDLVDFAIKKSAEPVDTTDNGTVSAGYKTYKPAKKVAWSGTINAMLHAGVAEPPFNEIIAFTGTADTGITYTGNIIITGVDTTVNTTDNNATKIAYTFQGTGALAEANSIS